MTTGTTAPVFTQRINVIKINPVRSGQKNGKNWSMQDAETIILNQDGSVHQVGVLLLPKSMMEANAPLPGLYDATFTLGTDRERRVIAQLATLTPTQPRAATPGAKA